MAISTINRNLWFLKVNRNFQTKGASTSTSFESHTISIFISKLHKFINHIPRHYQVIAFTNINNNITFLFLTNHAQHNIFFSLETSSLAQKISCLVRTQTPSTKLFHSQCGRSRYSSSLINNCVQHKNLIVMISYNFFA